MEVLNFDDILNTENLFDEWKKAHDNEPLEEYLKYKGGNVPKSAFLPDGIIDTNLFEEKKQIKKSLLFIAKEAYWYSENSSESDCLKALEKPIFWHKEVSYGNVDETMFSKRLSMLANAFYTDNYTDINKNHNTLQSCAVINLNKRGGFAYCRWETLEGYVSTYRKYIEKEISLINPDIIVCCGNGVKWLLEKYVSVPNDTKVISVNHPSYFALSDSEYLNQFECSLLGTPWTYKQNKPQNTKTDVKGIMFDTNKAFSDTSTFDMLTSEKISAYDDARRYVDSFNVGDIVFYYVKGMGVVAAGEICSDAKECEYYGTSEKYKMVRMIIPVNLPKEESALKAVSASRIQALYKKNFYWASTIKTPFLYGQEQCDILINELKNMYN